jgi:hypothetical protein
MDLMGFPGTRIGNAIVTNQRVGENDHLVSIRGICQCFNISGHARCENDFSMIYGFLPFWGESIEDLS